MLSRFSGKYLYDNKPTRDFLDLSFSQQLISINVTFAIVEYPGPPGLEGSNITLTAYMNSTETPPVGSVITSGIFTTDAYPEGTLVFNATGQSFNLVRIVVPYQVTQAVDFLVDNIIVTTANPILDTTSPVTTAVLSGLLGNQNWYRSDVTVSLSTTDDWSGVNKTEYTFDNVIWTVYMAPFDVTAEGTTTIYFKSTDNAGNVETVQTQSVKIDKTAPLTGVPTRTPVTDVLLGQQVTVAVSATDSMSGLANANLSYSLDNGTARQPSINMYYNASTQLWQATIPPQPQGTWVTYKIKVADNAGNQAVNDNAGLFYAFPVVPEFMPIMILPLLIAVTTLAVLVAKGRLPETLRQTRASNPSSVGNEPSARSPLCEMLVTHRWINNLLLSLLVSEVQTRILRWKSFVCNHVTDVVDFCRCEALLILKS